MNQYFTLNLFKLYFPIQILAVLFFIFFIFFCSIIHSPIDNDWSSVYKIFYLTKDNISTWLLIIRLYVRFFCRFWTKWIIRWLRVALLCIAYKLVMIFLQNTSKAPKLKRLKQRRWTFFREFPLLNNFLMKKKLNNI